MGRQRSISRRAFLGATGTSALLAGAGVGQLAAEPATESLRTPYDRREFHRTTGTSLDDFEDLSAWTETAGSLQADATDPYTGSQSGLLVGDSSDSRVRIARSFDGLDLASADLSMAIRLDEPGYGTVTVRALAPDWNNRVDMSRSIGLNMDSWFRADLGVTAEVGSPDLANVQQLVVGSYTGETPTRLAVDDLRLTPKADRGYVMLTFDDGLASQHSQAHSIMAQYGMAGLAAINANNVGDAGRLSLSQLRDLQAAGWEVGNHTIGHDHLPDLSPNDRRARIRDGKEWLVAEGFDAGAESIVYPFGDADGPTLTDASEYHDFGFIVGSNPHGTQLTDPLTVGRVNGDDVDAATSAIDAAARHNQLVVLMYHAITDADDGYLSPAEFEATMAHIDAKGDDVAVVTPSQYRTEVLGHEPATTTTTAEQTTTSPEPTTTETATTTAEPTTTETTTATTAEPTSTMTTTESTTPTTTRKPTPTPDPEPSGSGSSGPPGGESGDGPRGDRTEAPTATPTPTTSPTATDAPTSTVSTTPGPEPMTSFDPKRETELASVPTTVDSSTTPGTTTDSSGPSTPLIGLLAALGGAGAAVAYLLSGDYGSDR